MSEEFDIEKGWQQGNTGLQRTSKEQMKVLASRLEKVEKEREAWKNRAYHYIELFYDDPSITYKQQVEEEVKALIRLSEKKEAYNR